jgi:hypothetical protein
LLKHYERKTGAVLGARVIINIELPTNLKVFLENHISSLREASITRGNNSSALEEHNLFNEVDTGVKVDTIQNVQSRSPDNILYKTINEDTVINISKTIPVNSNKLTCSL